MLDRDSCKLVLYFINFLKGSIYPVKEIEQQKVENLKRWIITDIVVAVLDRSTADPFPQPGFCLLAKFYNT